MEEKKNIPQNINPIQVAVKVNAPIDRVWEAITQPTEMRNWFYNIDLETLRDGDAFRFDTEVNGQTVLHECLVLEMEKPTKFRYTWAYPKLSQGSSTVNWDLEEDGDLTEVIVTHETIHELLDSGIPLDEVTFVHMWKDILSNRLKDYIEA